MRSIRMILIALTLAACSQHHVNRAVEGEKVMQASKDWAKAAANKEIAKTLSYWADDATVMLPGQQPFQGKDAIRKMVEESFSTPGFAISWKPRSVEVSESGDLAYLVEDSQVSYSDSTGKTVSTENKAVTIWRKEADGSWKNVIDISSPVR